ncbi:pupal cuticle protein 27-like [Anticarsia gemmatalis]|uniref:pupal cuticle protein 27-like n=1 Tax=Anticarsia gemmatalis TaxID=129554 RepID=UPI003F76409B
MKLFIVLAAVTLAQAGQLNRAYLPPNARGSGSGSFLQTPQHSSGFQQGGFNAQNNNAYSGGSNGYSGFEARPERAQAARERNAAILRQDFTNDGETYSYAYETENGIYAEESGVATNGVQAQGGYSYTGDDGKVYSVKYTADANGYVPQGDHLPTSPPIPEEILKSLETIARAQAAGIPIEGAYDEAQYSGNGQQQYYNNNAQAINYNRNSAGINKAYLPPHA